MSKADDLIRFKTDAWKDPAMVAWYSGRMVENSATNRLKNRLEVDLCLQHARGETILDVGIGTGRGSLPLAARGMKLTGVDSSPAMLDETRRLAGEQGLSLTTMTASLDRLPFPDATFDSLISLNVLVHFPNWREILPEWARVVRPGGRLVFDVHSLDHLRAALGRRVDEAEMAAVDAGSYQMRLAVEDLVATADRHGLTVVAAVPYGAFLSGGNRNYLLGDVEDKHYWARLLSWLACDEALFDLALFLEQELIAHLTTSVTGRFMAVLEKRHDAAANADFVARNRRFEAALRGRPIAGGAFQTILPGGWSAWRDRLQPHLAASMRNRRLLEILGEPLVRSGSSSWEELIGPPWSSTFAELSVRRRCDRVATELSRRLAAEPAAVAAALSYQDLPLGEGCEYRLVEALLTGGFGRFSGIRS
jgi:SAM-dependent methyltransferase